MGKDWGRKRDWGWGCGFRRGSFVGGLAPGLGKVIATLDTPKARRKKKNRENHHRQGGECGGGGGFGFIKKFGAGRGEKRNYDVRKPRLIKKIAKKGRNEKKQGQRTSRTQVENKGW